jgi:hypothetical protein
MQFQHRLSVRLVQLAELPFVLLFDLDRLDAQGVLHGLLAVLNPLLDHGRRKVVGTTGHSHGHGGFSLVMSRTKAVLRLAAHP